MRPQEGSGGLRPQPRALDWPRGRGVRGEGVLLTPSCPPPAKSPRRRAGGSWGSIRPRAVTSPGLSCSEPASLVAGTPSGNGEQKENLTKVKEAAQQPRQGWRAGGLNPEQRPLSPNIPGWRQQPHISLSSAHGPARPEALAIPAEPRLLLARGMQASGDLRCHLARRRRARS